VTEYRAVDVTELSLDGITQFFDTTVEVISAPASSGHRELGPLLAGLAGYRGVEAARAWRTRTKLGWLRDAFGQPYRGWNTDADAAMWYLLRLLLAGAMDQCVLDVDTAAGLDAARLDNQAVLDRSLPPWCRAIVDQQQRNADSDGTLEIVPVRLSRACGSTAGLGSVTVSTASSYVSSLGRSRSRSVTPTRRRPLCIYASPLLSHGGHAIRVGSYCSAPPPTLSI
jgi:hypothetical protein